LSSPSKDPMLGSARTTVDQSPKQRLRRLRWQIEQLPPYPALLILAGPLAVIEPFKLATIFIAGEGHWITSGLVMLFAYAVSLFLTDWLFVVVKSKLLTLPFAKIFIPLRAYDPHRQLTLS
jgi:hypothetical protein